MRIASRPVALAFGLLTLLVLAIAPSGHRHAEAAEEATSPVPSPAAPHGGPDFETMANRFPRDADDRADVQWRAFGRRLGLHHSHHVAAYRGYANRERLWVIGRLLENGPVGGPKDDDGWWDNLKATYQRWASDEIPGAKLVLRYAGHEQTVESDDEGYYTASFALDEERPNTDTVGVEYALADRVVTGTHEIALLRPDAQYIVISDVDDTVLETGVTHLLTAARLTFLNNAKTRKPLLGAADLYQALARGTAEEPINPVIYLSNSAWNLYDLIRDFLDLNDLPAGPLLLRDVGLHASTSHHKIETLRALLERFDPLPVVLIGDSGQHDAEIYSEVASEHPNRVLAIYIRDIDPSAESEYDAAVDRLIEHATIGDTPFLRVATSTAIAEHAVGLGLVPPPVVAQVESEVHRDRQRDPLDEEAKILELPGPAEP